MFIFTFVKCPDPQHTSSWTVTSHIRCHTHTNTKTHKLLLQLCRAEQILQMNYWLCNSYSFVSLSVFTFSTIHWSCNQHNALWRFCITLYFGLQCLAVFLNRNHYVNRWTSETGTRRRARVDQKAAAEVSNFLTRLEDIVLYIYAAARLYVYFKKL